MRAALRVVSFLTFITFGAPLFGQSLPAAHTPIALRILGAPVKVVTYTGREIGASVKDVFSFRDPWFSGATVMQYTAYAGDAGTTAAIFGACPRCYEDGLLFHGSHSAAKVDAGWFLVNFGVTMLSSKLHRKGGTWAIFSGIGPGFMTASHARQTISNVRFYNALTPADRAQ